MSTLNDLAGFPMAMAVSQKALNAQMALAYGQSTHNSTGFPPVPWKLEDESYTLKVTRFEAPEVDFNTPIAMGCRLKLTIAEGCFSTYVVDMTVTPPAVKMVDTSLDGLIMYVTTPMQQLVHEKWSNQEFEVQALFADLERVSLIELDLSQDMELAIGGAIKTSLETVLKDKIIDLGKTDPQMLLFGGVKTLKIKESSGPLAPTESAYSTTTSKNKNGSYASGDLNYLLMLEKGAKIPTGAAVGAFNHSLQFSESQATLVLAEATILSVFVVPALQDLWPGLKLNIHHGSKVTGDPAKASLASELSFNVTYKENSYPAKLTKCDVAILDSSVRIDYVYKTTVDHWCGDMHCTSTGYETITFSFVNGELTQEVDAPPPSTSTSCNTITRVLADILTLGFDEIGRANTLDGGKNAINELASNMNTEVQSVFSRILLPGESVFTFQSIKLSGQMYVTATYK